MYPIFVCLGIIFWFLPISALSEHLIQTINGTIIGEEYNYYRIDGAGHLRLGLISWDGDSDLYISDVTLNPTFDNYELKSTTCGTDFLEVPSMFQRPVGVGVYGHPSKNLTHYSLSVYFVSNSDGKGYEYFDALYNRYDDSDGDRTETNMKFNQMNRQNSGSEGGSTEESLSETLWTILLTILQVFFEIIL